MLLRASGIWGGLNQCISRHCSQCPYHIKILQHNYPLEVMLAYILRSVSGFCSVSCVLIRRHMRSVLTPSLTEQSQCQMRSYLWRNWLAHVRISNPIWDSVSLHQRLPMEVEQTWTVLRLRKCQRKPIVDSGVLLASQRSFFAACWSPSSWQTRQRSSTITRR